VLVGGVMSVGLSGTCRKGNLTGDPTGDPDPRPFEGRPGKAPFPQLINSFR
jgi:hypothetical protein